MRNNVLQANDGKNQDAPVSRWTVLGGDDERGWLRLSGDADPPNRPFWPCTGQSMRQGGL